MCSLPRSTFAQGFTNETSFSVAAEVVPQYDTEQLNRKSEKVSCWIQADGSRALPTIHWTATGRQVSVLNSPKLFQLRTSSGAGIPAGQLGKLNILFKFYPQKLKLSHSSLERNFRWCLAGSPLDIDLRSPKISNSTSSTSVKHAYYSLLCYSSWIPKQLCNWCKICLMKC